MNPDPSQNNPASVRVCVLTGRKMTAIASVALSGGGAAAMLGDVFVGRVPEVGQSRYGRICDIDGVVLDSVVVGCEAVNRYVVHCHGNPLLTGQIAGLFARLGAHVQSPQAYAMEGFSQTSKTRIAAEAKWAMAQAATLEGAMWLARQIDAGLSAWSADWISRNPIDINVLQEQAKAISTRRAAVSRVVEGVRIALIGAPNSGKSTLLNWLAGRQTAIVSDTAGTTRDWVSMTCRIGPVLAEIVDTAGLDEALAARNPIEQAAQDAARQTAAQSDLILHLIDSTHPATGAPDFASSAIVLNVFTKIDLASDLEMLSGGVAVSATADRGLNALCAAIVNALQVDTLDYAQPIAFTPRQYDLLTQLAVCPDEPSARALLTELLGKDC